MKTTKKMIATLILVLTALVCCYAETHTIILVSRVEKLDAQYVIRNRETGICGESVIYSTDAISRQDVSTSFDIVQCCDSNGMNRVNFEVRATELMARENGKLYSTEGVSIVMDGVRYAESVSFTRVTVGAVAAGSVVAGFEVIWKSAENLADATYEACVTLTATAL